MLTIRRAAMALCIAVLGLTGCSSTEKVEPAKLHSIKPEIELKKLWGVNVGGYDGKLLTFSPVIVGDRLFALGHQGNVVALNVANGKKVWEQKLKVSASGGLGADQRHVYLALFDGRVIALDQTDGQVVWEGRVSSEALAPPQSNGRLVVVQTIDGKLFGLEATSGTQRWVYSSASPALSLRGSATPLIMNELTYAGFANGDVVAIENRSGGTIWQRKVGVPTGRTELERLVDIDGGILLDNGVLYTVGYQSKVAALDGVSGRELWSKPASSLRIPTSGYSNLYYVTDEDDVVALSKNSQAVVWSQEGLKHRALGEPAAFLDLVAVGDFEGYVHFLSQVDGRFVARLRPDSEGVRSQPLYANGVIYILGNDGKLSAWRVLESN